MNELEKFLDQKKGNVKQLGQSKELNNLALDFIIKSSAFRYSYNFTWMGIPIIQFPQDIVAMQEIIWQVKPDLIIETGVAHGGSLIFSASMLELIGGSGQVLGIDIDIREHNRVEIEKHPMSKRISLIEGSSTDEKTMAKIQEFIPGKRNILVFLDSNHTHDHVKKELALYSPLVTKGSYLVVFDTVIEDMPENFYPDRQWKKGDNPKTAVMEFLISNPEFEIDKNIQNKLLITVAPDGYLKRVR